MNDATYVSGKTTMNEPKTTEIANKHTMADEERAVWEPKIVLGLIAVGEMTKKIDRERQDMM